MKLKCIGGLANGQIVDVNAGSREHDTVRVRAEVTFELESFQESLKKLMDDTSLIVPYHYYKICSIDWVDESKFKRRLLYLCPIKWNKFEALAYVIGA